MKDALELFGMLCLSALAIIAGILGFAALLCSKHTSPLYL